MSDGEPIEIALRIDDPALAERLRVLLAAVDGLRLARDGQAADLILSHARPAMEGSGLTQREREVVALLAEGLSNKEIARNLGISVDTAKFHVSRVMDKLDATSRTDAVAHAARRGVIEL